MGANDAPPPVREKVRQLAADPDCARVDEHARGNMLSWALRVEGVCEAICEALDAGERLKMTTVKKHPEFLGGQPAYEIKPTIDERRFYVRMAVYQPVENQDALLLISVHLD